MPTRIHHCRGLHHNLIIVDVLVLVSCARHANKYITASRRKANAVLRQVGYQARAYTTGEYRTAISGGAATKVAQEFIDRRSMKPQPMYIVWVENKPFPPSFFG